MTRIKAPMITFCASRRAPKHGQRLPPGGTSQQEPAVEVGVLSPADPELLRPGRGRAWLALRRRLRPGTEFARLGRRGAGGRRPAHRAPRRRAAGVRRAEAPGARPGQDRAQVDRRKRPAGSSPGVGCSRRLRKKPGPRRPRPSTGDQQGLDGSRRAVPLSRLRRRPRLQQRALRPSLA